MEQLEKKRVNLEAALASFRRAANKLEQIRKGDAPDPDDFIRDSAIKRFEFTLDTLWKYLKSYLEEVRGVPLQSKSPKPIFRECLNDGLITEEETVTAIEMVDSRNMSSHIYKEEVADIISSQIQKYYKLIEKIVAATKQ